jgi:hypothetical protein
MTAPTTVQTVAGTLLKVSAAPPATYDAAGFTALTFTTIAEVENLGTYGKKFALVKHNPIGSRATVKRKGSYDNGQLTLSLGRVPSDAGQILAYAAAGSDLSYSYEIIYPSGEKHYFSAQAMSFEIVSGTVDSIQKATVMLEIDADIVTVAAT